MRGLCTYVNNVAACYCRGSQPGHVPCVVDVRTSWLASRIFPGLGPAIARDVWSVLARHCYRRLLLAGSTPCRTRCVVFVRTAIAVGNVYTDCLRMGPAIARDAWLLARHRYRRLSLTCSTSCRARARCMICVNTSSLSSPVIDVFETLPRSRATGGLCLHVIAIVVCP